MAKLSKSQMNLLAAIADATKRSEVFYVGRNPDTEKLVTDKLIEVNPNMVNDKNEAAARATAAGLEAAVKGAGKAVTKPAAAASSFAIITNAAPPPSKRGGGGGGAPAKYPFASMEVGQSFFVPNTDDKPDAVKSLQSSVASANYEHSEGTGEMETVTVTKRGPGNKAELDAAGNKIKVTKQREKRRPLRKFIVRAVEAGKTYGGWTPDASGALVTRVSID